MTKKRFIVFLLFVFIGGIALGSIIVSVYLGKSIANSMAILSMKNRAELEMRAFNAYKNESPEVGIWALTNLSEILNEDAKIFQNDRELILKDLFFVHARLALLFQTLNDPENYNKNIEQAIELSKKYYPNKFQSEAELIVFVKKIDSMGNKPDD